MEVEHVSITRHIIWVVIGTLCSTTPDHFRLRKKLSCLTFPFFLLFHPDIIRALECSFHMLIATGDIRDFTHKLENLLLKKDNYIDNAE